MKTDFDAYANDYRKIHTQNIHKLSGTDSSYFSEYKIKLVRRNEALNENVNILDLGCGDGINAGFFNKYFCNMNYVGLDVSEESINIAKKNYNSKNINFSVYNGEIVPYDNNTFDIILVACVIHHIDPIARTNILKECYRVLKSKGCIYIFEHNPYNPLTLKVVNDCVFDKDAILISSHKLKRIVKEVGFNNVKSNYTIFFPRKKIFAPILFLEEYLTYVPLGGQYYCKGEKL